MKYDNIRRTGLRLGLIVLFFSTNASATALTTIRVASGLNLPLFVALPPGDPGDLFVLEQHSGLIKIIRDGVVLPRPFLNIHDRVGNTGNEQGLLGLAFHPDYTNNGYFYVDYTNYSGNTVISRFQVSSDPDSVNPNSETILLSIVQPYSNHNGGMLAFGPNDGYLYIGMGDGGSGGDPENRAQNDNELLGKILRIDVNNGQPYGIPPTNPFVGIPGKREEIWAKGVRNPWRFCFDRANGNLYIADVGQDSWEEIDYQGESSLGGENYGWRLMEGMHCYNPPINCDPGGLTNPIYEYGHNIGCSITGGYVYRGGVIPALAGTYFFADFCSARIWSFNYDGANISNFIERTAELAPSNGQSIGSISSFGEDGYGEIYITDLNGGEIFKIVPRNPGVVMGRVTNDLGQAVAGVTASILQTGIRNTTDTAGSYLLSGLGDGVFDVRFARQGYRDTTIAGVVVAVSETTVVNVSMTRLFGCNYLPGDINANGVSNGVDVSYAVNYFKGGDVPPVDCASPNGPCSQVSPFYAAGDVNGNCEFNGIDITYIVRYFKGEVSSLLYCPDCPPIG